MGTLTPLYLKHKSFKHNFLELKISFLFNKQIIWSYSRNLQLEDSLSMISTFPETLFSTLANYLCRLWHNFYRIHQPTCLFGQKREDMLSLQGQI